jgi:hypothetical protein
MTASRPASWLHAAGIGAVGIVPVAVDWVARVVVSPRPFWAYWCDPEAMYYYSSLELLRGQAPLDIDNPGTPVQLFGALLAWMTGGGPDGFATFLNLGYVAILLATLTGCVLLARRFAGDVGACGVVALVWVYFLCPQALARAVVWAAEPFQFLGGVLLLIALDRALRRPTRSRRALVAGIATGALVGLKFTFLGFVPALMVGLYGSGRVDRGRRMAAGWLGAATGFALVTLPAAARWPDMVRRVLGVAVPGDAPVWADPAKEPSYLDDLLRPLASGTVWYGLVAIVVVAWVAIALWRRRSNDPVEPRDLALGWFALSALVLTHVAASRAPYLRYHLPNAVAAAALVLSLLRITPAPRRRLVSAGLAVILALGMTRQVVMNLGWHGRLTAEHVALRAAAETAIRSDGGDASSVVLYGGRFPHPALALLLFARTPGEEDAVARLHPSSGFYDRRSRRLVQPLGRAWDYLVLEDHDLATFPGPHGAIIATVGEGNETSSTYRIVKR